MHLITQGLEILLESGLGRRYSPSALQWGQVPRGKASWEREARPSLLELQGTGSQHGCPEHSQELWGSRQQAAEQTAPREQDIVRGETVGAPPPAVRHLHLRGQGRGAARTGAGSSPATQTPSISGTCSHLWGESDHRGCVFVCVSVCSLRPTNPE